MNLKRLLPVLYIFWGNIALADRQVAITIDDLPRGGDGSDRSLTAVLSMTDKLLKPFREEGVPVVGFVNEGLNVDFGPEGLSKVLNHWLDAGAELGNHSYSHFDVNTVPLDTFTADIQRGENVLAEVLAERELSIEYFRHPFLHTGATFEKKNGLQSFLNERNYRVAPVTLDNADYLYASVYMRPTFRERVVAEYIPYMESIVEFFESGSIEVIGREIPQILLLHANQLNADLMPELLAMFRRRGYTFVSLAEALQDEAYSQEDSYIGPRGISWLHRWAITNGAPLESEPNPPAWLNEALKQ